MRPTSQLLAALLFTGIASQSLHATTVSWGASPSSRTVYLEDLTTEVSVGSLVLAGTFANESFSLSAGTVASNVAAIQLAGGWSEFTGTSTLGISNIPGSSKVFGSVTDNSVTADGFNGDSVYLWVFNAPTVGAATQMGIFRATTATIPWVFPTNAGGVGDTVTLSTTSSGASVIAAIGGVGSTSGSSLALAAPTPVPEPATFAGVALLTLGAMSIRQRRRR